jgi:multicomponent Na+:H+ antiporter subunit E
MKMFMLNLLLALLWMFMWASYDIYTLTAGLVIGYLLVGFVSRASGQVQYGTRVWRLLSFTVYFMTILFKANLQVAREVITPGLGMSPRIIAYPVAGMTDGQITTFSNALTLTPGTLTTDVAEDGRTLYIHCMYAEDRDRAVAELDELRDRIMREVFE